MIRTHVYSGNNTGGPVDYSRPVGDSAAPPFVTAPLPAPSQTWFAVRNYDDATGLEEQNVDARTLVEIDAAGVNVSGRPGGPTALAVAPGGAGQALVTWAYLPNPVRPNPTQFNIYMSIGYVLDWTKPPAATVPFAGPTQYAVTLSNLPAGQGQVFGVRGILTPTDDGNVATVFLEAPGVSPANVLDLSGAIVTQGAR